MLFKLYIKHLPLNSPKTLSKSEFMCYICIQLNTEGVLKTLRRVSKEC